MGKMTDGHLAGLRKRKRKSGTDLLRYLNKRKAWYRDGYPGLEKPYVAQDVAQDAASDLLAAIREIERLRESASLDRDFLRHVLYAIDEFHPPHEAERAQCWLCGWRFAIRERLDSDDEEV